jgi:hypothetical protein
MKKERGGKMVYFPSYLLICNAIFRVTHSIFLGRSLHFSRKKTI